jgi:putative tryptophan/tyrosine transport system substrate-binding protein
LLASFSALSIAVFTHVATNSARARCPPRCSLCRTLNKFCPGTGSRARPNSPPERHPRSPPDACDLGELGLVKNPIHPEGNVTGIADLFGSIGGKWLQLLKEAVPRPERVAWVYDPELNPESTLRLSIADVAADLSAEAIDISFRNSVELVHAIDSFAINLNSGLIISPAAFLYLDTILLLAEQHRLPTVTSTTRARQGTLIAYGPLFAELDRRAASFVDRILRGALPHDLPLEYPTRFKLEVNLKTAKAIGFTIPESVLLQADEVIE